MSGLQIVWTQNVSEGGEGGGGGGGGGGRGNGGEGQCFA